MTYLLCLIVDVMVEKLHNANHILLRWKVDQRAKQEISKKQNSIR